MKELYVEQLRAHEAIVRALSVIAHLCAVRGANPALVEIAVRGRALRRHLRRLRVQVRRRAVLDTGAVEVVEAALGEVRAYGRLMADLGAEMEERGRVTG
jgi:hypothetical protein